MPVFEFRFTCLDKDTCKNTQLMMSDFRNKNVKGIKSYDHTALKKFPSWEDAIKVSKEIEKKLGDNLIDLTIVER